MKTTTTTPGTPRVARTYTRIVALLCSGSTVDAVLADALLAAVSK